MICNKCNEKIGREGRSCPDHNGDVICGHHCRDCKYHNFEKRTMHSPWCGYYIVNRERIEKERILKMKEDYARAAKDLEKAREEGSLSEAALHLQTKIRCRNWLKANAGTELD